MIGNKSATLQYLQDLFIAMKSFYHPSNAEEFQVNLIEFISKLAEYFLDRVYRCVYEHNLFVSKKFLQSFPGNVELIPFGSLHWLNHIG